MGCASRIDRRFLTGRPVPFLASTPPATGFEGSGARRCVSFGRSTFIPDPERPLRAPGAGVDASPALEGSLDTAADVSHPDGLGVTVPEGPSRRPESTCVRARRTGCSSSGAPGRTAAEPTALSRLRPLTSLSGCRFGLLIANPSPSSLLASPASRMSRSSDDRPHAAIGVDRRWIPPQ